MAKHHYVTPVKFDAVLLDLDGVITSTDRVHATCWKRMFDEYLSGLARDQGKSFTPFDIRDDYQSQVDGKPRYDGVRSFLRTRNIELPEGTPDSPPGEESVCGLGNRKNELIHETIDEQGVQVFPGSVEWIRYLQRTGLKTAIVTSSKNCDLVLRSANLSNLFGTKVDGNTAAELKLMGKPAPDTYLEAARMLGATAKRSVVVEDAISGVQAGRAGGFGLVIGVARHKEPAILLKNGADIVVSSLGELLPEA